MRSFIEGCRQILFPVTCIYCQKRLQGGLAWLCLECHATLRKCKPIGVTDFNRALEPGLLLGFALWEFHKNQPVQRLQHHLKYKKMPRIGLDLGRMMGDAFSIRLKKRGLAVPDHILPIPLHRRRFLERGYNQSSMLARAMADSLGCACSEGLLIRTRPTRTQTGLSRQERQDNLDGAFALQGEIIRNGQHIVLVDDVMTTGATMLAAAHSLLSQYHVALSIAVLAHAPIAFSSEEIWNMDRTIDPG